MDQKGDPLSGLDPMLVSSFIAMAAAGWNGAQAIEYRRNKARLDSRSSELAVETACVESESRAPRLFPPRIYELAQTMRSHAVRGELDDLAAVIRAEQPETCQLVLDQCVVVADCIVNGRSAAWPPSEPDLRMIAAITTSCMEGPEFSEGRAGPPATIADPVVYACLSRAVVRGEFLEDVFPAGEAAVLAVRITARTLVAFLPGRPWLGHLELIWRLQTASGVNWPALSVSVIGSQPWRVSLASYEAELLLERVPAGVRESHGPAAADAGDPTGAEGMAAQGGTGGACQVRAAFGPVKAGADEWAPRGGWQCDAECGEPARAVAGERRALLPVQQAPAGHGLSDQDPESTGEVIVASARPGERLALAGDRQRAGLRCAERGHRG